MSSDVSVAPDVHKLISYYFESWDDCLYRPTARLDWIKLIAYVVNLFYSIIRGKYDYV